MRTIASFKDKEKLAETLEELSRSSRVGRVQIPSLAGSTTLLDVFKNLRDAKTETDFNVLANEHKDLIRRLEGKPNASKLINLRANPLLACVADATGRVNVGSQAYDVFDEEATKPLVALIPPTASEVKVDNYVFTELPPEALVQGLPCGPWTLLPGYPTKFFDASVAGRNVVVQLWKGSCPDYLGKGAGGIGAEVGLYNKGWIPKVFWWPDYEHKQNIEFTLLNPATNEEFFSASGKNIWWLHKWMKFPSYEQYKKDQNNKVPASPQEYIQHVKIDGVPYSW